jgi:PAS domain S-box-containing protein
MTAPPELAPGRLVGRGPQLFVAGLGVVLAVLVWVFGVRDDFRPLRAGVVLAGAAALAGYFDLLRTRQREVERLVVDRTRQLAAANAALEAGRARLHRQVEVLGRMADDAGRAATDRDAVLRHVTGQIALTLEVARVGVWRFTADRSAVRCVAQYDVRQNISPGTELRVADFPAYFAALADSRLIAAADARADPRTREFAGPYLTPLGVGAMLAAPLLVAGACAGVLCCEHAGPPRAWQPDEEAFALAAANLVSLLIEGDERRAAEGRFRTLVENAFDGVTCYDRAGRITYVSPSNERTDGRTPAETVGTDGLELIHPDDRPTARAALAGLVARPGEPVAAEMRTTHKNGGPMWVEGTARFVPDLDGGTVVLNWREVTDRKRAEQAVRRSEERFRLVWETVADGMRLTDERGTILQVNPALCRLVGLPAESLVGSPMSVMYLPEAAARNMARHGDRFRGGDYFTAREIDVTLWNGRRAWFEVTHRPLPPTADQPQLLLTIYRDVTARKRQALLVEQTHRAARVGGWELDFATDRLTWTDETYRIHEVTPGEYTPTTATAIDFYVPEARPQVAAALARARARGEPWEFELELITARGNRVWAHAVGEVETQAGRAVRAFGSFQDITARKRAEEHLRQTAAQLRAALALGRMGTFRWDRASGVVAWSPELHAIYGVPADAPVTFDVYASRIHPDDRPRVLDTIGRTVADGGGFAHQYRAARPDGTTRWVMARAECARGPDGAVTGLAGVCQDITEQKEAEAAIRRLNEELESRVAARTAELEKVSAFREAIIRTAAEGISVCEATAEPPHVRFSVWNERMTEITGYTMDEINRLGWYQTMYPDPDVRDRAAARMTRMRTGDDLVAEEWTVTHKSGTPRTFAISTSRVEVDGRPSVVALMADVTARTRAEEERARNVNLLRAITDGTQDAVFVKDLDGRYLFINPAGAVYLGHPPAEVIGRTDAELVPQAAAEFTTNDRDAAAAGETRTYEETLTAGGETVTFWVTKGPYRDGGGRLIGSFGVSRNITERKRFEERLRRSEERYRAFVAHSTEGIWRFEVEPPIPADLPADEQAELFVDRAALAECNAAMARMYGFDAPAALLGRRYRDFFAPLTDAAVESIRQFVRGGYRASDSESREPDRDGRERVFLNNAVGVVEGGRLVRVWGTQRDVTERTYAEEALRASLREKETLLREVHHRVKNNLQIVSSLLYFQRQKMPDGPGAAVMGECRDRLRSMVLIHQRLYQADDLSRVDLAEYVRTLVNELQASYAALCPRVAVRVDAERLRFPSETALPVGMLVCELVTNAFKYAFPGGRAGSLAVSLARAAGGRVLLAVADDGVGLPPGFAPGRDGGFGWQLIAGLALQLGAELVVGPPPGTRVEVAIPDPDTPERGADAERVTER